MKTIGVFIEDENLQNILYREANLDVEIWEFFGDLAELEHAVKEEKYTTIIISDRLFGFEQFVNWLDQLPEERSASSLIVLLSNHHHAHTNDRYIKLCLSYGLQFVRPGRSANAIVREIRATVSNETIDPLHSTKQLLVFCGTTPNIGTTIVSYGTAVRLAQETEHSVAYLCLNLKSSKIHRYLGYDEPVDTLDGLRAELKSQSLIAEDLRRHMVQNRSVPRLYTLFGNQVREQAEYFTPEEIDYLLDIATACFDICVVEVNAYWDNAATVCAMLKADRRIIVTTQDLTHFQEDLQRWVRTIAPMYGIELFAFDLAITQHMKRKLSGRLQSKHIRKETGLSLLGLIQHYDDIQDYVNEGRLMEMFLGNHPMNKELSLFSNAIITLCQLSRSNESSTSSVGKRRWFHVFGNI